VIGEIRKVEVGAVEHRADGAVEAVGHHRQRVPEYTEAVHERAKPGVDLNGGDEGVHLCGRGAHKVDLAHHALSRADAARLPLFLDVPPRRSGEPLKQHVRRIDLGDRSVEIEQDATFHTRYRHATRTR
jgi:hypothetical protein